MFMGPSRKSLTAAASIVKIVLNKVEKDCFKRCLTIKHSCKSHLKSLPCVTVRGAWICPITNCKMQITVCWWIQQRYLWPMNNFVFAIGLLAKNVSSRAVFCKQMTEIWKSAKRKNLSDWNTKCAKKKILSDWNIKCAKKKNLSEPTIFCWQTSEWNMKMCEKENLSEPKIVQQTDVTAAFCSLSPWRIRRIKTWIHDIAQRKIYLRAGNWLGMFHLEYFWCQHHQITHSV